MSEIIEGSALSSINVNEAQASQAIHPNIEMAQFAIVLASRAMDAPDPNYEPLSSRHTESIDLMSQGHGLKTIGAELELAPSTVHSHLKKAYKRLGAKKRTYAIYRAFQEGEIKRGDIEIVLGEKLSNREIQVLNLIARGLTNSQIAQNQEVSEETIKSQIRNILRKLGVESRTHATRIGIEADLIPVEPINHDRRNILRAASLILVISNIDTKQLVEKPEEREYFPHRHGMYVDWITDALKTFSGRLFAVKDVAKILYMEAFDSLHPQVRNSRAGVMIKDSRENIKKSLSESGFNFFKIPGPYGEVRLVCLGSNDEIDPASIPESTRLSEDELGKIAKDLRQKEIIYRQEEAKKKERQKERQKKERENNTPCGRLAVFLDAHRNQQFPIGELTQIAFPDSKETPAQLRQRISKILNDGTLHSRLERRGTILHKANFRPKGYERETAILVCTEPEQLPQWEVADQWEVAKVSRNTNSRELRRSQREIGLSWKLLENQEHAERKEAEKRAKLEIAAWKKEDAEQGRSWQRPKPLAPTKPKATISKKETETSGLKREFTDHQAKLLAREMIINKLFKNPTQELVLRALLLGIDIEETAVNSNIPVEQIIKMLKKGDRYLGFLPKEPETDSW